MPQPELISTGAREPLLYWSCPWPLQPPRGQEGIAATPHQDMVQEGGQEMLWSREQTGVDGSLPSLVKPQVLPRHGNRPKGGCPSTARVLKEGVGCAITEAGECQDLQARLKTWDQERRQWHSSLEAGRPEIPQELQLVSKSKQENSEVPMQRRSGQKQVLPF